MGSLTKIMTRLWVSCKFFKTRQPWSCLTDLPPRSSSAEAPKSFGRKDPLKKTTLPSLYYNAKILKISVGGRKLILNWTSIRRDGSFHSYLTRRNNDFNLPRVPIGASNQAS